MVSVCLPSDALLQHLPSYLSFSYLGREVSLHGCSSKAQPLLLTLDKGCLLTAALPDLQLGIAPKPSCASGATAPWTWVDLPGCFPWPRARDGSSQPLSLASDAGCLLPAPTLASYTGWLLQTIAPDLGCGVAPLGRSCAIAAWLSQPLPLTSSS